MVAWCAICLLSRNHRVVIGMLHGESTPATKQPEEPVAPNREEKTDAEKELMAEEAKRQRDEYIANALLRCMETEKLYLNPLLSLNDLAQAVGCNKTYVSSVVNSRGKTFYDYVNEYRIAEACRIMETSEERLSMADVATQSGFNSMSSFNRYFSKIKGVTPANYYRSLS